VQSTIAGQKLWLAFPHYPKRGLTISSTLKIRVNKNPSSDLKSKIMSKIQSQETSIKTMSKTSVSLSVLLLTLIVLISPVSAKPLRGVYWPYPSDISLEIESNRFREGAEADASEGEWQSLSNLKEIKRGVIYYRGSYFCHRNLWPPKGGAYVCRRTGVRKMNHQGK
jgi:hypothetical protein